MGHCFPCMIFSTKAVQNSALVLLDMNQISPLTPKPSKSTSKHFTPIYRDHNTSFCCLGENKHAAKP